MPPEIDNCVEDCVELALGKGELGGGCGRRLAGAVCGLLGVFLGMGIGGDDVLSLFVKASSAILTSFFFFPCFISEHTDAELDANGVNSVAGLTVMVSAVYGALIDDINAYLLLLFCKKLVTFFLIGPPPPPKIRGSIQ